MERLRMAGGGRMSLGNCCECRSDKPEDACLCYCAVCRIVYVIYMLSDEYKERMEE